MGKIAVDLVDAFFFFLLFTYLIETRDRLIIILHICTIIIKYTCIKCICIFLKYVKIRLHFNHLPGAYMFIIIMLDSSKLNTTHIDLWCILFDCGRAITYIVRIAKVRNYNHRQNISLYLSSFSCALNI